MENRQKCSPAFGGEHLDPQPVLQHNYDGERCHCQTDKSVLQHMMENRRIFRGRPAAAPKCSPPKAYDGEHGRSTTTVSS